jgi:hypothetical protein
LIRRLTVSHTTVGGRSKIDIVQALLDAGATVERWPLRLPLWPAP